MSAPESSNNDDPSPVPGLQPERTALAWFRTGLALSAGSVVVTRTFVELVGIWAVVPAVVGGAASVGVIIVAVGRYRRRVALPGTLGGRLDGVMPALLAAVVAAVGISGLLSIIALG